MAYTKSIADHWGTGDVYARILDAMEAAAISPETVTVAQLAPVDHFHARGLPATIDLADALPVQSGDHLVDIGCGLGGPARYFAERFGCRVSGVDITEPFVLATNKLSKLLQMQDQVEAKLGDGQNLPYGDTIFDGGYTQHVTMNIADRSRFFDEAIRVLKPGAYFALTEHGLGPTGAPHYPLPWSDDGSGAYLVTPEVTQALLRKAGFVDIKIEDTGEKYLDAYHHALNLAAKGASPSFSIRILMGPTALDKTRNAARNIEEGRTHPIQVVCQKPS